MARGGKDKQLPGNIDRDVEGMKYSMAERLWAEMMPEFEMTNVYILAIPKNGPALECNDLTLRMSEGRSPAYFPENKGQQGWAELMYRVDFYSLDADHDTDLTMDRVKLFIRGTHSNGRKLEIRGRGYMQRFSDGNVIGEFLDPPIINIEREPVNKPN